MKKLVKPLLAVLLFTAASASIAQQAPKPEQVIKWRQSVYQVLAWNNGRIKNNVEGTYNKDEVIRAANAIAAIANSGLGALYPAGTETGKQGSRLAPVSPGSASRQALNGRANGASVNDRLHLHQGRDWQGGVYLSPDSRNP